MGGRGGGGLPAIVDEADDAPGARRRRNQATALIVFAGPGHEHDLAAQLRARGVAVTAIDAKVGGKQHDVRRPGVGGKLLDNVRRGYYDFVFAAPPCESYSVAHKPQLRSRRQPEGLANAPAEWRAYLKKHNELAAWTARLLRVAHDAGVEWATENPADRGQHGGAAYWERFADHAPLWKQPAFEALKTATAAQARTFAYCAFGAPYQKLTTIWHSTGAEAALRPLDERVCKHGREQHAELLRGRDSAGDSRAGNAAEYPTALNEFFADAIVSTLLRRRAMAQAAAARATDAAAARPHTAASGSGGRVADGWQLDAMVAAACEAARREPPRFASLRNRRPEAQQALRRQELPGDLHDPPTSAKPQGERQRRLARERAQPASQEVEEQARARRARMAQGPISVGQLYLDGAYEEVQGWLQQADAAAAALREGRTPPAVPTVRLGQERMQPFARGVVWDCSDPADCRPVEQSTRDTVFPGRRQIDRAALRAAADELGWRDVDADILDQMGEGGLEPRSACELETVLAWHHTGVNGNVEAAAKVIEADWLEEWSSRPKRHLPFAPARILPRNVILQERARLLPGEEADGSPRVELYDKPRITQNSSHGGDDSVNAAIDADETGVVLPTAQQFGRGYALVDTAGELGGARACGYVVDAESAYRFCVVQRAAQWTQCYAWWDQDGNVGFCVDRRLGFGGAFAPNRFERVSTLCAAYAQMLHARFDAAQPPPAAAQRWMAERRALQAAGQLPRAAAQVAPRYLQVFIDDFCGAALDDRVVPPPEVADVEIDPRNVRAAGGTPAAAHTRVHVHAQLVVLALRRLGLSAAPNKVVVGDPVVALGFRVGRTAAGQATERELGRGKLDCPELKRVALRKLIATARARAVDARADRQEVERITGKLCNMAQVLPELKPLLHGGYTILRASWIAGGARRWPRSMQLRGGGEVQAEWIELLDAADDLLDGNEGVELAPEREFPSRVLADALTVTTDASGIDGVGGWALDPARPSHAWVVSEVWPSDVQAALTRAAQPKAERDGGHTLSMPAAEAFGQWAVAEAAAMARGGGAVSAVTAIGDCDAAAAAINAASSGKAQMRRLLRGAAQLSQQWLAVSVPRELNSDADRLSHPAQLSEVLEAAETAGLTTTVARIPQRCWQVLRHAIEAGAG